MTTACAGLDTLDSDRLSAMLEYLQASTSERVLSALMPDASADVLASVEGHCRFAHGALLVFSEDLELILKSLTSWNVSVRPVLPSVVVRDRLAHRQATTPDLLDVRIVRAVLPRCLDQRELELFVMLASDPDDYQEVAATERTQNLETHFAFQVMDADLVVVEGLFELLTGPGRMVCEGGGYNPREDSSVFYFQGSGSISGQPWPRRMELITRGHFPALLEEHRAAVSRDLLAESVVAEPLIAGQLITEQPGQESADGARRSMLQLLTGAWTTQAIHVAAELDLAGHIHRGVTSHRELAVATGSDTEYLHRLIRFLESIGLVVRDHDDRFGLTELGELLRGDIVASMRDVARLYGGVFYDSFRGLGHSIRTGENAFAEIVGQSPFEYFADHPAEARIFEGAMSAGTSFLQAVPAMLDLSEVSIVVDVGGGDGEFLGQLLGHAPHLHGVLFDLPHVLPSAEEKLRALGCLSRCQLVAGSFTETIPAGGELYVLSRILHDWDDDRCLTILSQCHASMRDSPDATLAIIERPIPVERDATLAVAFDIHMMVNNLGGRERSVAEYRALLDRAGFELLDEQPLPLDMALLLARPKERTS